MHELNTLDEAVEFIVKMVRFDGSDTYPYRIRETFPVTVSKEAEEHFAEIFNLNERLYG
jgi:hypothetical protein